MSRPSLTLLLRVSVSLVLAFMVFGLVSPILHDNTLALILRIIVIVACSISMIALIVGFIRFRSYWNEKTRDYWFGRLAWCATGIVGCTESIIRHTSFRYSTVFFVVAGLVTLKGVLQRGSWGTSEEAANDKHNRNDKYTG